MLPHINPLNVTTLDSYQIAFFLRHSCTTDTSASYQNLVFRAFRAIKPIAKFLTGDVINHARNGLQHFFSEDKTKY